MATIVETEKFKFNRDEFTKKKTFEFAKDNGFTGKDKEGRDIKKNGADDQWTKADVKKCPVVKDCIKKSKGGKNSDKDFQNKNAAKYFAEQGYDINNYDGERNEDGHIRKMDIVKWEKRKEGLKGIKQFTSGAKELVKEFNDEELLMKVLNEFYTKTPYTTQSMWGKKQVEKSIEKIEIYNKIKNL